MKAAGDVGSTHVAIVDVGLGNHASVANMVRKVGGVPTITRRPEEVTQDRLILPGVGAFDRGMAGLEKAGWIDFLRTYAKSRDVLGICLGMQLLGESSEEGSAKGLGLVPVEFRKFDASTMRVPHMGWNGVRPSRPDALLDEDSDGLRFYFAHSFRAECDASTTVATADYGGDFPCVVRSGRVAGVQFHPEKSHRFGMDLVARFLGR